MPWNSPDRETRTAKSGPQPGVEVSERDTAQTYRPRSWQSHVSGFLPLAIVVVLGLGLLVEYYSHVARRPSAPGRLHSKGGGTGEDVPLPTLGPIEPPVAKAPLQASPAVELTAPDVVSDSAPRPAAVLTPAPVQSSGLGQPVPARSPAQLALDRKLSGPAFERQEANLPGTTAPGTTGPMVGAAGPEGAADSHVTAAGGGLAPLLVPTLTPAVSARELPTQQLLLAKGTFIDCTLETAIDSSLPGMTTCITATDTFGVDGKVVLLERGSKLVGETRGQVQQGSSRLFVLWTEARTPSGVVVPLASPGTDELGRGGVTGDVERHFWQRFGAAILISVIDGGLQAAARSGSGTVVYDTSSSRDVATEALRSSVGVATTLLKPQGDRIQVLVARDLDFRSVYDLKGSSEQGR